jgi:Concanavalin A-like lectin/glucanases superfamily
MWGLTSTGFVTVNVFDSSNNVISATASSVLLLNTWTHIAQTFSTSNGIRLYINGVIAATASASTGRPVGPFAIIGASPSGTTACSAGSISRGQFYGSVDEFRVFRNQLTANDICRLAYPT